MVFLHSEGIHCSADSHTGIDPATDQGCTRERNRHSGKLNRRRSGSSGDETRLSQPDWAVYHNVSSLGFALCEAEARRSSTVISTIPSVWFCRRLHSPPCPSIDRLTYRLLLRVLIEEANHLRGGVRALGIGVGAGGATARPRVPEPVDCPPLRDGAPSGVAVGGAGVGVPAGNLSLTHRPPRCRSASVVSATGRLGGTVVLEQSVSVARVNRLVVISVEYDRGHYARRLPSGCRGGNIPARGGRPPLVHRGERGGHVVGRAGGETRMDADRGVEVGVGLSHDRRHRPTSRHANHVHPAIGHVVLVDDLARDARDQRRLAPPALLI